MNFLIRKGKIMSSTPETKVTLEAIKVWWQLQEELKQIREAEILLRRKIFAACFPSPKEGTNDAALSDGYVLKGKYTISREIDPGAFGAIRGQLLSEGIKADALVQYKPFLVMKEYRALTAEQAQLFEQCLIVKPGSPALEIVLPAKAKKVGEQA